jgi:hypothetical protein
MSREERYEDTPEDHKSRPSSNPNPPNAGLRAYLGSLSTPGSPDSAGALGALVPPARQEALVNHHHLPVHGQAVYSFFKNSLSNKGGGKSLVIATIISLQFFAIIVYYSRRARFRGYETSPLEDAEASDRTSRVFWHYVRMQRGLARPRLGALRARVFALRATLVQRGQVSRIWMGKKWNGLGVV